MLPRRLSSARLTIGLWPLHSPLSDRIPNGLCDYGGETLGSYVHWVVKMTYLVPSLVSLPLLVRSSFLPSLGGAGWNLLPLRWDTYLVGSVVPPGGGGVSSASRWQVAYVHIEYPPMWSLLALGFRWSSYVVSWYGAHVVSFDGVGYHPAESVRGW